MHRNLSACALGVALGAGVVAAPSAEPGDEIHVQVNEASVHSGPGRDHPEILRLEKGHPLIELQRVGPGLNRIFGNDFKYIVVEIPEESGSWVNVGIVGTGGKDGWVAASAVGTAGVAIPSYNIDSYCKGVADISGGSYVIEKGCLQMEVAAKAAVEGRMVEPRIMVYCDEVASVSGGTYSILDSCITMEQEARDSMRTK